MKLIFKTLVLVFFLYVQDGYSYEQCFLEASQMYNINIDILKSIAKNESGFNQHARNINSNGTVDYGIMQINSSWRRVLGDKTWYYVVNDACYNIKVGAWILALNIQKYGYTWTAVGAYNAVSRHKRLSYVKKIYKTYTEAKKRDKEMAWNKKEDQQI